ncbi:hypothetical protein Tco_0579490 [Tanacetum coccineum]
MNVLLQLRLSWLSLKMSHMWDTLMLDPVSSTWMDFGGNMRDLGSFGEKTYEISTLHQSQRKKCVQWLETTSRILVTSSGLTSDGVRLFKTASEHNRLNEALEDSTKQRHKLRWLSKNLKKGSPFRPDCDEPPLGSINFGKKTFYKEAHRESDQIHQTCENRSLAMTHKLDDMIELPKSQPKKTYEEDLECEMVLVKIPRCMQWLDTFDEPIGDLDMMEDEAVM